jgi:hypothetical protein
MFKLATQWLALVEWCKGKRIENPLSLSPQCTRAVGHDIIKEGNMKILGQRIAYFIVPTKMPIKSVGTR